MPIPNTPVSAHYPPTLSQQGGENVIKYLIGCSLLRSRTTLVMWFENLTSTRLVGVLMPAGSPAMSINRGRLPNWTAAHRGFLIPAALPIVRLFPSVRLSASLRWGVSLWMKITICFIPACTFHNAWAVSLTINYPVMKKFTLLLFVGLVAGIEPASLACGCPSAAFSISLSQERLMAHQSLITEY